VSISFDTAFIYGAAISRYLSDSLTWIPNLGIQGSHLAPALIIILGPCTAGSKLLFRGQQPYRNIYARMRTRHPHVLCIHQSLYLPLASRPVVTDSRISTGVLYLSVFQLHDTYGAALLNPGFQDQEQHRRRPGIENRVAILILLTLH
jgi:hypothetical protein